MIKKHIPNAITCCNLLCGCVAIVQAFEGQLVIASYLVILAAIFDFFDGFAARLLKVSSAIGKDLDSLADMVTFGVLPGVLMFQLLRFSLDSYVQEGTLPPHLNEYYIHDFGQRNYGFIPFIGLIIPIFSAIRLAKFNNDDRQTNSFIGLPTPANAILICSIILMYYHTSHSSMELNYVRNAFVRGNTFTLDVVSLHSKGLSFIDTFLIMFGTLLFNTYFLCAFSVLLSLLLIAEIPLFALKFKHFKWKGNEIRFVFLAISLLILIVFQFLGVMLTIILYVLMSLLNNKFAKKLH